MKNFSKQLLLCALVLALGLGIGLPRYYSQNIEPEAVQSPGQTPLDWALGAKLELPMLDIVPESMEGTLLFCGDAMIHSPQINDAYDKTTDTYDFTHMLSSVEEVISSADYAVANLETTFAGPKYTGNPSFSAPDEFGKALKKAGFDMLLTANNHSYDRGFDGLSRTLDTLDELGLAHVGTYRSAVERTKNNGVHIAHIGGIKVAFLGYSYGTNFIRVPDDKRFSISLFNSDYLGNLSNPDTAQITVDFQAARALEPDLICVLVHWGDEYKTTQNAYQEQIADLLIKNGADIILGGHSHVPQPMEWRTVTLADGTTRKAFVVYSLGNFISSQRDRYTDTTAAVQLTLRRDAITGEASVTDVAYQPLYRLRRDGTDEVFALLDVHRELAAYETGNGRITEAEAEKLRRCIDDCREILGAEWTGEIVSEDVPVTAPDAPAIAP